MMLKRILIISFFFVFASIQAQQIYFCKSHTENGTPVDARNVWSIKPWGSLIYILFDNEGNTFDSQLNYMFIDRYIDREYRPWDSKAINVQDSATWFAYNYKFTEPGKYRVYVVDQNKKELASEIVTIQIESDYVNNRQGTNSLYYDDTKIKFCERVIAGQPINAFNKFSLSKLDSNTVTVFVNTRDAIETSVIVVDVWEKPSRSIEYDKFIGSKKYALTPSWDYVFFKYKFEKSGYYKFNIYNENEVLITAGYLEIVK